MSRLTLDEQEDALVRIAEIIEEALLATVATPAPSAEKPASAAAPRHGETPVTPPSRSRPVIQPIHGWTPPPVQALQQQTALVLKVSVEFKAG